jgi:hypothetical protein
MFDAKNMMAASDPRHGRYLTVSRAEMEVEDFAHGSSYRLLPSSVARSP